VRPAGCDTITSGWTPASIFWCYGVLDRLMAIDFHPPRGTILRCDYTGLQEPEMVKDRPVVIVSPRARSGGLVTVAPISTTPPEPTLEWHHQIVLAKALSPKWPELTIWVKCDMLNTFCTSRLDRFHTRVSGGARKYYDRRVSPEDLTAISHCISKFLSI
jgi:uncharacterized protein YifN (PemK superfamily)